VNCFMHNLFFNKFILSYVPWMFKSVENPASHLGVTVISHWKEDSKCLSHEDFPDAGKLMMTANPWRWTHEYPGLYSSKRCQFCL
ncbi:hypothetical protein ACJX0J_038675, partial [Zea mays]